MIKALTPKEAMQYAMQICASVCNTISVYLHIEKRRKMTFQIKPNRRESENKTIRFPLPLVEKIENVLKNNDATFSSFVIQACEYALENMESSNKKHD